MNELTSKIQIKGLRDSLLVSLSDAPWEEQSAALLAYIDGQQAFFHGARVALDVGQQVLKVNEMVELRDNLSGRGVSLWAVVSESSTTEMTAQLLGLATRVSKPRPEEQRSLAAHVSSDDTALFIGKTLRSGTRVEYAGSVVVLGDVNPGAEIVAEGSIVIWGRLRGSASAGMKGDGGAVICALDMLPMRLQLGALSFDAVDRQEVGKPEMACVRNGSVVIESWPTGNIG